jgi:hypothetical protein
VSVFSGLLAEVLRDLVAPADLRSAETDALSPTIREAKWSEK